MNYSTPTLDDCDKEPIHIIGSIQSYGYVLVLNRADLIIEQVSKNVERLLDTPLDIIIGSTIDDLFPFSFLEHFNHYINDAQENHHYSLSFELNKKPYILSTHVGERLLFLEIEPDELDDRKTSYHRYAELIETVSHEIEKPESVEEVSELVLRLMKPMLGFDRMMVYQFDEDEHGEVIAELADDGAEKYLGLKFPATDIPKQARQLYLENMIRGIWDVNDTPVAIYPEIRESDQKPLDLTHSFLRSVSPIHVQYLKNMGLRASFSISIVVRQKLWGMLLCHHSSGPNRLNIHQRRASSFIGSMLSQKISGLLEEQKLNGLRTRMKGVRETVSSLLNAENLHQALADNKSALLQSFKADAYFLSHGGETSKEDVEASADWVDALCLKFAGIKPQVFHTHHITTIFPDLSYDENQPAGLLLIKLSRDLNEFLVFFRNEQPQTVNWGGNPRERSNKTNALHPRHSFSLWKEELRGSSVRWTPEELLFAEEFRMHLIENILILATRNSYTGGFEVRKRLEERNIELEAHNQKLKSEIERLQGMESNFNLNQEVLNARKSLAEPKKVKKNK